MKFSIITPTYNDCESIVETLDTIVEQTYKNWELWIVDDGSTDNTKIIVEEYKKSHNNCNINYIYQENQDQLNAILNVIDKLTGDYVYILHSDDLFVDSTILERVNKDIKSNNCDVLFANKSLVIDEKTNVTGCQKFQSYNKKEYIMATQLLWLGRNLYWDFAFFKKEIFLKNVKNNYLLWNTPFWLNYEDKPSMLEVTTVKYPFIKYRVFPGNYINNEIGKLNVINGELRTATNLMKHYYIPFYKLQYQIFRLFNKLNLLKLYRPFYLKKESKNKVKVVKFIIEKRYKNEYGNYQFLTAIIKFFENYQNRTIEIKNISKKEFIYYGKDMRKFNNNMLNNKLSKLYINILKEMHVGFNEIVTTKELYNQVENITKFLAIYPYVKIRIKD